jgi:hypothetical protein
LEDPWIALGLDFLSGSIDGSTDGSIDRKSTGFIQWRELEIFPLQFFGSLSGGVLILMPAASLCPVSLADQTTQEQHQSIDRLIDRGDRLVPQNPCHPP